MFNLFAICFMVAGIIAYKYVLTKQLSLMMRYNIMPIMRLKWKLEFVLKYLYPVLAVIVIINSLIK